MGVAARGVRALVYGGIGVLLFSVGASSQFIGVETGLSDVSYTSTLMQSAINGGGGGWNSYGRSTISYSGNKPAEQIVEMIKGANWRNYEKYTFSFTGQKINKVVVADWDTVASAWASLGEFSFTWNAALLSTYNYTGAIKVGASAFDVVVTSTFVYNADKVTSDTTSMVFSSSGAVVMTLKETNAHTYGSGYELAIKSEWDDGVDQYVLSEKDSTTKCSDGLDSISFSSTRTGSAWVLKERNVMSYNADRTISQVLTQDETSGNWVDGGRVTYGYGAGTMAQKLAGLMQAAQQMATRKLVSMNGNHRTATEQGVTFNAMGRHSATQASSATNFAVVKNASTTHR